MQKTPRSTPNCLLRGQARTLLRFAVAGAVASALTVEAHVKWFTPCVVSASPRAPGATLANPWFWIGIALVLTFFLATRMIETSSIGQNILTGIDQFTHPLWLRLDDFVRVVIAAFFVAVFAVGGVYLTPELKTSNEWVSWMQLTMAAFVFSRRTMPLAAAGIVLLWGLALTEYDLFHLLDYLALGMAVAGYLVLASFRQHEWRRYRFDVLRWGLAIALMWSSLEKFAYPDWFYPLIEEKPFLTLGMPRDVFIPMAGVAEFTMGFGLLWTALVRRLCAVALFVIFNAAVFPFGRIDLIGHALIVAIVVAVAADPTPQRRMAIRQSVWTIPVALGTAIGVFASGYWGLHLALYGASAGGAASLVTTGMVTQAYGAKSSESPPSDLARKAYEASMTRMRGPMQDGIQHPDPDVAFVLGMIPHHQAAIDMAEIQLQYGKDPENRKLSQEIIAAQRHEIQEMKDWLAARGISYPDRS